jgi:hypothetical protein
MSWVWTKSEFIILIHLVNLRVLSTSITALLRCSSWIIYLVHADSQIWYQRKFESQLSYATCSNGNTVSKYSHILNFDSLWDIIPSSEPTKKWVRAKSAILKVYLGLVGNQGIYLCCDNFRIYQFGLPFNIILSPVREFHCQSQQAYHKNWWSLYMNKLLICLRCRIL